MNVIYYINDKMPDTAEAKYKYDKNSPKLSRVPQGRRLGIFWAYLEIFFNTDGLRVEQ